VVRLVVVAVALVLWFALACVIVPRIVPPIVDLWEQLDLRMTGTVIRGIPNTRSPA
jgi:hypothetical protein